MDVYSFGCLTFEVLAGKPPFSAASGDELLTRHLRSPAPNIQAQNNAVSAEMAELIANMMEKDPTKRPISMSSFLEQFAKIRVYRPGMKPPEPAPVAEEGS